MSFYIWGRDGVDRRMRSLELQDRLENEWREELPPPVHDLLESGAFSESALRTAGRRVEASQRIHGDIKGLASNALGAEA